jgi:6-phosphofructokinase 1
VPEIPFDIDQVAELIRQRSDRGRYFSIVVVAEGAKFADGNEKHLGASVQGGRDEFGHVRLGGVGATVASEIEKLTGFESRSVVLGHIQRGGSPTAYDRVLATRYGLGAIDMVHRGEFGQMSALRGNRIISIPLAEAIASNRVVDREILDVARGILDKLDYKISTTA